MHLLIAAAGSGRRMEADANKLLLNLAGRPVLAWTLDAAFAAAAIHWIGLVGQAVDRVAIEALLPAEPSKPVVWVQGGDTRQASVACGLAALPPQARHVLIHDGARCLVEPALIDRCAAALQQGRAVVAATPVTDTIKVVDADGRITATPDRAMLWAAQTPQGFPVEQLKQAHGRARQEDLAVTDDAALFEALGWPVQVVASSPANLKLTTPFDLRVAELLLRQRGTG
ncbi:MAG: 2-C-methyl-D-erythritol 4-phosphate cytidylyltransferase [Aphanocapsa feldmannii 277cV]|uniref:2-C-methyl-D-erythritol 4-phosphate cytidylyltransferase n=2 Tax=Aphanocapsa feldmannii TaxID=192050 RepID=A0A524RQ00_9CHRO|nr:MAG: 2-C-methyl-D-erythritol 4-phosphate cytidylyltransferase [Aphanocapsa feldmannii 288cV]TGG94491.1 MAG: 2-C-methyl-D-erythritol 4-phosphate cytidylyltransferase [Aphanocapsa feldmannii 277cV]TGH24560.1 MAG: 2-C-methyl-D-erythritol 4-phosphate cytidylyltransferase [Aphanocapsa feldmannii 277cI]